MEIKNALALVATVLLTFAVVSALQTLWGDTIAAHRAAHQKQLLHETLLGVEYDSLISFVPNNSELQGINDSVILDSKTYSNTKPRMQKWWQAKFNNQTRAVIVQAVARGYGGDMIFLLSFNKNGKVLRARIIRHRETPGIADFLSTPDGATRAIDGVSGATITSNTIANSTRIIERWVQDNADNLFN